jgi:hypothetical protein
MGTTTTTLCDGCSRDLTYTGNCEDYYLTLAPTSKRHFPGAGSVTLMAIYPPLDRTHTFCGLECLTYWNARRLYRNSLSRAWWADWKKQYGHVSANGNVSSYPSPKRSDEESRDQYLNEHADAQFPITEEARRAFSEKEMS